MSINNCVFSGRLGQDPELKQTQTGVFYCRFQPGGHPALQGFPGGPHHRLDSHGRLAGHRRTGV